MTFKQKHEFQEDSSLFNPYTLGFNSSKMKLKGKKKEVKGLNQQPRVQERTWVQWSIPPPFPSDESSIITC